MDTFTGTITAVGGTVVAPVTDKNVAVVYITGTFAGSANIFEVSPDSTNGTNGTWYAATAARLDANTVATTTGTLASGSYAFDLAVQAAKYVRIRATGLTSGTLNVRINVDTTNIDPAPAVPTHAVTQSGSWTMVPTKATTGGLSRLLVNSAATTNATVVKATGGTLYSVNLTNLGAATRFVKFYQKATAPTVGTDTPILVYAIPAGQTLNVDLAGLGDSITTGIGMAITGGLANSDTTAVGAGEVVGSVHFA